ncbi:hypothetical protein Ppa06_59660 [Planomonospora parontospora subsp. parontospora]|uniref:Uncharacterized protein n=2 Tax=Planomonospora parontospora TaxID=58119 RepID=A0AA37F7D2_9ACTN|nr:hypothetical protein [Planomonospora parontospora]GGK92084.1 hypothetical protein GCM10010126_59290 [Planomonospora parontospora]GII12168.1 hypothetical protein Ppa06_59660 [Planomonospora parontospora subsp. parontospora]
MIELIQAYLQAGEPGRTSARFESGAEQATAAAGELVAAVRRAYEGRARMVDSPVGSGLRPGEILIAASTDPGWTPLFLIAGALVMEVGE